MLLTYLFSEDHTFKTYRIFRGNFTFSSMETMEARDEPSNNWYFAKGPLVSQDFYLSLTLFCLFFLYILGQTTACTSKWHSI
jgi:hypothetical protein